MHLLIQLQSSLPHRQVHADMLCCSFRQAEVLDHQPAGKSALIAPRCWCAVYHSLQIHLSRRTGPCQVMPWSNFSCQQVIHNLTGVYNHGSLLPGTVQGQALLSRFCIA